MKARRLVTTAFLLALLTLPLSGCSLIVPASDRTRPQVTLAVFGLREDPFTIESDTTLTVPRDDDFHLLATGVDRDGGIRSVSILGAVAKRCSSGDIGVAQFWDPVATFFEDPAVGIGDEAKDRRFVALLVPSSSYYSCRSGSLDSTVGTYRARAENFHGGVDSSPVLTLRAP